eukprot:4036869-Pyramimonas_sp.AAC.2
MHDNETFTLTPIMDAFAFLQWAKAGSTRALLEHGIDVHHKDVNGQTALLFAAQYAGPSVVKILLEHGANPNDENVENETPLLLAASNNNHGYTLQALIEKGANTDHQGPFLVLLLKCGSPMKCSTQNAATSHLERCEEGFPTLHTISTSFDSITRRHLSSYFGICKPARYLQGFSWCNRKTHTFVSVIYLPIHVAPSPGLI